MKTIYGLELPSTLDEVCNPKHLALLIYDMQVGIVDQIEDAQSIVSKVREVLDVARASKLRIFFTRHLSLPPELMGAFQFRMAMIWQRQADPRLVRPWFLRDSPGFPIVPGLAPLPSEAIFDKITMSAFEGTPLAIALRDCGVRAIAIAGIAMEVGIEPTVRHAADLGLIPVVISDACGTGHADAGKRSLESLAFAGDAIICDVGTFAGKLRHLTPGR